MPNLIIWPNLFKRGESVLRNVCLWGGKMRSIKLRALFFAFSFCFLSLKSFAFSSHHEIQWNEFFSPESEIHQYLIELEDGSFLIEGTEMTLTPVLILSQSQDELEEAGEEEEVEIVPLYPGKDLADPFNALGVLLSLGVDLTHPRHVSFGVIIGDAGCSGLFCAGKGLLIRVAAGFQSGEASIGYASVMGLGGKSFLLAPLVGYSVRASFLQTWGGNSTGQASSNFLFWESVMGSDQSYVGVHLDMTLFMFRVGAGLYYRVLGDKEGSDWVLNFPTLGFGF
jgi:hypothetical protein